MITPSKARQLMPSNSEIDKKNLVALIEKRVENAAKNNLFSAHISVLDIPGYKSSDREYWEPVLSSAIHCFEVEGFRRTVQCGGFTSPSAEYTLSWYFA